MHKRAALAEKTLIVIVLLAGLLGILVMLWGTGIMTLAPQHSVTGHAVAQIPGSAAGNSITGQAYTAEPALNEAPVYTGPASFSTPQDTPLTIDLTPLFTDPENDALSFSAAEEDQIAVALDGSLLTLTPAASFAGERTLSIIVSDGVNLVRTPVKIIVEAATQPAPAPAAPVVDANAAVPVIKNATPPAPQTAGFGTNDFTNPAFTPQDVITDCSAGTVLMNTSTVLTQSISTTGTCIKFNADNIVLDCAGFNITYGSGGASANGINAVNRSNITVISCTVQDTNAGGVQGFGINFTRVNNSFIINTTVKTNGTTDNYGIFMTLNSSNNTIVNSTIRATGTGASNYGIYLFTNASNNLITNSTIVTNGTSNNYGVYIQTFSVNNTIQNNSIVAEGTSSTTHGIRLESSANANMVANNTITIGTPASSSNNGIYLFTGESWNTISGNTIVVRGTSTMRGIFLDTGVQNNTIANNIISVPASASSIRGIEVASTVRNNTIVNNTLNVSGTSSVFGIEVQSTANNITIADNVIRVNASSSTNYGIYLLTTVQDSNITGNTVIVNGTSGNTGIRLESTVNNITLANNTVRVSGSSTDNNGVQLLTTAMGNRIENSSIFTNGTATSYGIILTTSSDNNTILNNSINTAGGDSYGVRMDNIQGVTIINNTITTPTDGLFIEGTTLIHFSTHTITTDNRINGSPIFYYGGRDGSPACPNNTILNAPNASHIDFLSCSNITLTNFTDFETLTLVNSSNMTVNYSTLFNNKYGLRLFFGAMDNTIIGNNITANTSTLTDNYGIWLQGWVLNNTVLSNNITTMGTGANNYGIYLLSNASNNTIAHNFVNTSGTTSNNGIRVELASNNNTIFNNTVRTKGTGGSNFGIVLFNSIASSSIINNTIVTNGTTSNHGIYIITFAQNATIANNSIVAEGTSSSTSGIRLESSANANMVANNTVVVGTPASSSNNGIYLLTSDSWNTVSGNSIVVRGTSTMRGIFLDTGVQNNTVANNFISVPASASSVRGIEVASTVRNNTIVNNTMNVSGTSSVFGIYVQTTANNNTVVNNTVRINASSSSIFGIYLFTTALENNITGNTVIVNGTTTTAGLRFESSANNNTAANNSFRVSGTGADNNGAQLLTTSIGNRVENNTFILNGTATNYGIVLSTGSDNNTFINNTIATVGGDSYGVRMDNIQGTTLINNTINGTSDALLIEGTTLIQFTTHRISPDNLFNGSPIIYYGAASPSPSCPNNTVLATLNASHVDFVSCSNVTLTNFTDFDVLTLVNSRNITINYSRLLGGKYGVRILVNGIGNTIAYNNITANTSTFTDNYGIWLQPYELNNVVSNNTIIGNNITTMGVGATNNGIELFNASNNTIANNVVNTSGTSANQGIRMESGANNNTVINNVVNTKGTSGSNFGVVLFTSTNGGSIVNNTIITNGTSSNHGVYIITFAQNATVASNTIIADGTSSSTSGIRLETSANANMVANNTIVVGTPASSSNNGVYLITGDSWNTISGNTIVVRGTSTMRGIFLDTGVQNNTIANNIISVPASASSIRGIEVASTVRNNTIVNNTLNVSGTSSVFGIYAQTTAFNNTIANNTVRINASSSSIFGIYLFSTALENNITGNTVSVNGTTTVNGIRIESTASNNTFDNNNITALGTNAYAIEFLTTSNGNRFNRTMLNNPVQWIQVGAGSVNENFTNTTFAMPNGSIAIFGSFNLTGSREIAKSKLNITANRAFLNSTNASFLNQSGEVQLFNVVAGDPRATVDFADTGAFVDCLATQCTLKTYAGGVLVFNVSGFTTYSWADGGLNVSFTKTDSPDPVGVGATLSYTISFMVNSGNASNVTLTDTYPNQTIFLTAQPSPITGTNNTFILGNLTNGTTFTVNITVQVLSTAAGAVINNTANASFQNQTGQTLMVNVTENTSVLSLPVIAQVILNSTNPLTNDTEQNLTLFIINATDPENNTVQNITDWRINGTSRASYNAPFDNATNTTTSGSVRDYSLFGNNGTLGDGTLSQVPNWTARGQVGGAYLFDGVNDVIRTSSARNLTFNETNETTAMAWINVTPSSFDFWLTLNLGTGTFPYRFGSDSSGNPYWDMAGSGDQTITTFTFASGKWYHVAFVGKRNGSTIYTFIYVNGTRIHTQNTGIAAAPGVTNILVGTGENIGTHPFNGMIDEVQIYRRALSDEQIAIAFQEGLAHQHSTLISKNETLTGEVWSACATPNDNMSDGTTVCSNNVTINAVQNASNAPSIAQVILNTTDPLTNDTNQNLTVFIINATDADNNVVQNITDWRVNNLSLALLNMPFETNQSGNITSGAIRDYSIFGNNGTLGDGSAGAAPIWNNTDLIGGAYAYDGSNDLISVPDSPIWAFGTRNFTMDLWVNFKVVNAGAQSSIPNNFLAQDEGGGATNKWIFTLGGGVLSFHINNPGGGFSTFLADTSFSPATNQWYHLAVRRNGSTFTIYINGTKGATEEETGAIPDAAAKVLISSSEGLGFINGELDEAHIWNRSLSDQEIALIYREGNQSRRRIQTFVAQDTTTGEVWQTCVTPNDNITDGATACSNNVTIQAVPQVNVSNITVVKTDAPDPVSMSSNLTYVITVTSTGNINASNVTVNDTYPAQVIFLTSQPPAVSGTNNTFILGNLTQNTTIMINITVLVQNLSANAVINNTINATFQNDTGGLQSRIATANTTVTFAQAPPSIAQVILNTTDPLTNDTNQNLTLFIINATDPNDDSVQNITDFRLNNLSIAVLNMPFETNTSSIATGAIRDYSIFGNNGTLGAGVASQAPRWNRSDLVGGDYVFDGSNDYIDVADNSAWAFGSRNFTIDFWVNFNVVNAGGVTSGANIFIAQDEGGGTTNKWLLTLGGDTLSFLISNTGTGTVQFVAQTPFSPATKRWYHLAVRRTGDNFSMLANGTEIGSEINTSVVPNAAASLTIGQAEGLGFINGQMDEVHIWNRSLTNEQVRQLYLAGNASRHLQVIVAGNTRAGDVWSACATPNDNNLTGASGDGNTTCSNNVTINAVQQNVTVFNVSNLSIIKTDSPDPVENGTTLRYTINVTSNGNGTAYNVTVNDTYPAQVIFNSSQPPAVSGTNNTFILGNLTPGTSVLINITVNVTQLPNGTVINNTVNVTFQNETSAVLSVVATQNTTVQNVTPAITSCPITINQSTTLTQNLSAGLNNTQACITLGNNSIALNCAGFILLGNGSGKAILAANVTGVNITNCVAQNWRTGILLDTANSSAARNNTVLNATEAGISVQHSRGITVANSTAFENPLATNIGSPGGIVLNDTRDSIIMTNNASGHNGLTLGAAESELNTNILLRDNNATGFDGAGFGTSDTAQENITLINNRGTSRDSNGFGMTLNRSALINNTGTTNSTSGVGNSGIFLRVSGAINLSSNFGVSGAGVGIFVRDSANISLQDTVGLSNLSAGIRLVATHNSTLLRNNGTSNFSTGISIFHALGDVLRDNVGRGEIAPGAGGGGGGGGATGINLENTSFTVLINNTGISNASRGIGLGNNSQFNNLTGNTGLSNFSAGISISASANNTFANNTARSAFNAGMNFSSGAAENVLLNNTISVDAGIALLFELSSGNNTLRNTTLYTNGTWIFSDATSRGNNLTNTLFEGQNGSIRIFPNTTLPVSTNASLRTLNITFNAAFLNSSALGFLNLSGQVLLRNIAFIDPKPTVDFEDDGTFTDCTSTTNPFCTELGFSGGMFTYNTSHFTTYSSNETPAGGVCPIVLNVSTTLTQNITCNQTAIIIANSSLILDCAGFTVTYGTAGGDGANGVAANGTQNITVKNCRIRDGNASGQDDWAINLTRVNFSTFINNTIQTNGTNRNFGIAVNRLKFFGVTLNDSDSALGNVIANNTIRTLGTGGSGTNYGIYLEFASGNNITGNNISTNGTFFDNGIVIDPGHNNTIVNNIIFTHGDSSIGIDLEGNSLTSPLQDGIVMSGNNITTTTQQFGCCTIGIETNAIVNAVIANNTINTTSDDCCQNGIFIVVNTTLTNFTGNRIFATGDVADIGIEVTSRRNRFLHNRITVSGTGDTNQGITLFSNGHNNTFFNTTIDVFSSGVDGNGVMIESGGDDSVFNYTNITTAGNFSDFGIAERVTVLPRRPTVNLVFSNTILNNPVNWISMRSNTSANFTNTTFEMPNGTIRIPGLFQINRSNGSDQTVNKTLLNITFNRAFLNSTNLTFLNASGVIMLNGLTFADPAPTFDFADTGTFTFCTATADPFCTELGFSGGVFTFNTSHFTTYSSAESSTNITSCPVQINVTTTLTQPLSSTGNCIFINSSNLVLECSGFSLNHLGSGSGTGINVSKANNVTVRNCFVENFSDNIKIELTNNSAFINDTARNSSSNNFRIEGGDNNLFANNTMRSAGVRAFDLIGGEHTLNNETLVNNVATGTVGNGMFMELENSTIVNNTGISTGIGDGIVLTTPASGNLFANNSGQGNSGGGIAVEGVYSTIINNTGTSNASLGMQISGSFSNLSRNRGITNGSNVDSAGITMAGSFTHYFNNTGINTGTTGDGIRVLTANDGLFEWNNGTSAASHGINFAGSRHNLVVNNTGTTNGTGNGINFEPTSFLVQAYNGTWTDVSIEHLVDNPHAAYRYATRTVIVPPGTTRIRLTQNSTDTAHLDLALLDGVAPLSIADLADSSSPPPAKLAAADYDVIEAVNRTIELAWASPGTNFTVSGIEEDLADISKVSFPNWDGYYNYTLGTQASLAIPWKPASSHPAGNIYTALTTTPAAVLVSADVTPDNTLDLGGDWIEFRVFTKNGTLKFPVNRTEQTWGTGAYVYTDKVAYQHKTYNLTIPLSALGAGMGDTIRYQLGYYGTGGGLPCSNNTVINNTGVSITGVGIRLNTCTLMTLLWNNGTSINGSGIGIHLGSDNNLTLNNGTSVNGPGILLTSTTANLLVNNTGRSTAATGINLSASTSNILINNTARSPVEIALHLALGSSSNLINGTIISTDSGIGLSIEGSLTNAFANTTFFTNSTWLFVDSASTGNNLTNTLFEGANGSIRVLPRVTTPASVNATLRKLNITFNRAFLNSTNLTFLNATGVVTLRNLVFSNPLPIVDFDDDNTFAPCTSPQCTNAAYAGGALSYSVASFTTYSSTEGNVNVTLTKTDNPDPVNASAFLNYTITVNVTSDSPANITLTDFYPPQIIFQSAQPSPITGTNNTFIVGNLTNGTTFIVNITVLVLNVSNGTVINNTANISFQNATGSTVRLNVTENTTVLAPVNVTALFNVSNISVTKTDSPDPVENGTQLSYTITVTSNGNGTAFNVTVNDTYPFQVVFNTAQPSPLSGTNNTFIIGNLTPGTVVVLNITVNVTQVTNGTVINNTVNVTFQNETSALLSRLANASTTVSNVTPPTPPSPVSSGGSGGAGFGSVNRSSAAPPVPQACVEGWACEGWSACANGKQVRTCTDLNRCGTTRLLPATEQQCTTPLPEQESAALPQLNIPQGAQLTKPAAFIDLFTLWLWPLLFIVLGIVLGTFAYLRHEHPPHHTPQPTGRLQEVDEQLKRLSRKDFAAPLPGPRPLQERAPVIKTPTAKPSAPLRRIIRALTFTHPAEPAAPQLPAKSKPLPQPKPIAVKPVKPLKPIVVKPAKPVVVKPFVEPRMKHEEAERATAAKLQDVNARLKELERKLKRK